MSDETCPKMVYDKSGWGRGHVCGKPVKRDGMCGVHASAVERVRKSDEAAAARKAEAQEIVDRLAPHGVTAYANPDGAHITTSPKALADLLDRMADR